MENTINRKASLLILFILLFNSLLFSENKYTFSQFGKETVDFISLPLRWDAKDYLKIGLIGAGTGVTMFADQPVRNAALKNQRYHHSIPIEFGRMYGELYSPVVFFGGFAVYSLITDDITSRKIGYEIGQACLYGGVLTYSLKMAIGRARPYKEEGAFSYHPFSSILNQDNLSMPGGHSAASVAISTVLSRNVKPVWLKVLVYAPAGLTIFSRVYQDKHWTSDCFTGAALGYFIATWVVDKHEKAVTPDTKETQHGLMERIQFQPLIMGNFYSLSLKYKLPPIN